MIRARQTKRGCFTGLCPRDGEASKLCLSFLSRFWLAPALHLSGPALDAGNSSGLTTDQRGLPRPIDDPNVANAEGGDGSDIGAYEADPNLRINGFGKTGGDIWLSFNSLLGRIYRVESTDKLPPTWNVLTNGVIGTGGRFQALDGGAASLPKRFYRTVQLP